MALEIQCFENVLKVEKILSFGKKNLNISITVASDLHIYVKSLQDCLNTLMPLRRNGSLFNSLFSVKVLERKSSLITLQLSVSLFDKVTLVFV